MIICLRRPFPIVCKIPSCFSEISLTTIRHGHTSGTAGGYQGGGRSQSFPHSLLPTAAAKRHGAEVPCRVGLFNPFHTQWVPELTATVTKCWPSPSETSLLSKRQLACEIAVENCIGGSLTSYREYRGVCTATTSGPYLLLSTGCTTKLCLYSAESGLHGDRSHGQWCPEIGVIATTRYHNFAN